MMNELNCTRRETLLGTIAATSALQQPSNSKRAYVVPFSDVLPLRSSINDVDYLLYVRTPPNYAASAERYPLIVTLDADYQFSIAGNHLEHLADREDQGPQAILVSIAYAGVYPDRDRYRAERSRDYTPIFWPDGGYGPKFQAASGGGPKFQRVIAEEILPLIDARYRTDPNDRTLIGHSYGGLFSAWMLHTRPDLFSRYLLVSPSLWYANEWMLNREEQGDFTALTRKTYVYVGVGAWEEQPEKKIYMLSWAVRFAEQLRARVGPYLAVHHRVFEDETHASIFPAAFSTGIRHLFRVM